MDGDSLKNELLAKWELVRQQIARGQCRGWVAAMLDAKGQTTVNVAGQYEQDQDAALKASLRLSYEMAAEEAPNGARQCTKARLQRRCDLCRSMFSQAVQETARLQSASIADGSGANAIVLCSNCNGRFCADTVADPQARPPH